MSICRYDVTNVDSLKHIAQWMEALGDQTRESALFFLVGNKVDLKNERVISTAIGNQAATEMKFCEYFETSAKFGTNLDELFSTVALKTVAEHDEDYSLKLRMK